jgi:cadmium resistance protein CadD (predicted permease)
MKKAIILGFFIMFIGIVIGMILNNWMVTVKICGVVGLICLSISGLLNGLFVSGDRNRANYLLDAKEDRNEKSKITDFVFAVGLPNIILAVIVFLVINKS